MDVKGNKERSLDEKTESFEAYRKNHKFVTGLAASFLFMALGIACIFGGLKLMEFKEALIDAISFLLILGGLFLMYLSEVCFVHVK